MSRPVVLVVGGTGAVGAPLCRDLAAAGACHVVVAGRRLAAAQLLAAAIGAEARRLDLNDAATWTNGTAGVDLVVTCMDQTSTDFVAFLFAHGIGYADITATDHFFHAIESLPPPDGSWCLLSVGLAPGLTNIMARHCADLLDNVDHVEIGIMTGSGDSHGAAGLAWIADRLFDPKTPPVPGRIDFGPPWGKRKAYSVDFSDQHSLLRTSRIASATTRLCFESRLLTGSLFPLARTLAGSPVARNLTVAATNAVRFGSRIINVAVEGTGSAGGQTKSVSARFFGEDEATTTARLASLMIRRALMEPPGPGIFHSDQLFGAEAFLADVRREGIGRIELVPRNPDTPAL